MSGGVGGGGGGVFVRVCRRGGGRKWRAANQAPANWRQGKGGEEARGSGTWRQLAVLVALATPHCRNTRLQHTIATHYCNTLPQHTELVALAGCASVLLLGCGAVVCCNSMLQSRVAAECCSGVLWSVWQEFAAKVWCSSSVCGWSRPHWCDTDLPPAYVSRDVGRSLSVTLTTLTECHTHYTHSVSHSLHSLSVTLTTLTQCHTHYTECHTFYTH